MPGSEVIAFSGLPAIFKISVEMKNRFKFENIEIKQPLNPRTVTNNLYPIRKGAVLMMEKEKLRKADAFSGAANILFGAWIVRQALKMPMKDSWGGVQNVWFVSPALFPLFVGLVLMVLGFSLLRTASKMVGIPSLKKTFRYLMSSKILPHLRQASYIRFYAIAALFLSFIYVTIPRIDFFLCSILFLSVFITMFYFDDDVLLGKLFIFYLAGVAGFLIYFSMGIESRIQAIPYPGDILALCFISAYCLYAWSLARKEAVLRKKYRTGMIISFVGPFTICPFFKYFLLVPMPHEGLIVAILDYFWYLE